MAQHMRLKHPKVTYVMSDLNPDLHSAKEKDYSEKKESKNKKQG